MKNLITLFIVLLTTATFGQVIPSDSIVKFQVRNGQVRKVVGNSDTQKFTITQWNALTSLQKAAVQDAVIVDAEGNVIQASQIGLDDVLQNVSAPASTQAALIGIDAILTDLIIEGTPVQKSANFTVVDSEVNRFVENTSTSAIEATIPSTLGEIGDVIVFQQIGSGGKITPKAGSGVTLTNTYETGTNPGDYVKYRQRATNEWIADLYNATAFVPAASNLPTLSGSGTQVAGTAVASIDVPFYTASNGRLHIIHVYAVVSTSAATTNTTIATPSGWTLIHNETVSDDTADAATATHAIFGRFSDGAETGSVTVSWTGSNPSSVVGVMSGWDDVNSAGGVAGAYEDKDDGAHQLYDTTTGTGTGITNPSVTSTGVNRVGIAFYGFGDTRAVSQAPANFTTQAYKEGTALGADSEVIAYYVNMPTATTIGADAIYYDQTSKSGEGVVIALIGS